MAEAPRRPHLTPLTSLRFFAAFHVVVYHNAVFLESLVPTSLPFLENLLRTGYSGVNLFFVLSGFILAYTYLHPSQPPDIDARKFWTARFARIYPLYFFALLVVAPLVIGHFWSTNPPSLAIAKIATSGTAAFGLLQAWVPPLRAIWNPPGWTLSAEAFFYAVFPLVAVWVWRLRPRAALGLAGGVWLLGLLPALAGLALLPDAVRETHAASSSPEDWPVFLTSTPLLRLPEFVLGIALARAFFPPIGREDEAIRFSGTLAVGFALLLFVVLCLADHIPRLLVHAGLLDPIYGGLLVALAHSRGPLARLLSLRPLVVLGEASYAIYLLHSPLGNWMSTLWGMERLLELGPLYFVGYSAVLLAASVGAFYWLENPARLWIRRRVGGIRRPPAPDGETAGRDAD